MDTKVYLEKRNREVYKINETTAQEKRFKHFPDFPSQVLDDEAKQKMLRIMNAMYRSLYIIHFLHMEKQQDKNQTTQSFAQILDNVKKNNYLSTNNVLRDLYSASLKVLCREEIQIDLRATVITMT